MTAAVRISSPSSPVGDDDMKTEVRRQLKAQLVASDREEIEPLRAAIEQATDADLDAEDIQPAMELLRSLEKMHHPLTFTDVARKDMEALQAMTSRDEIVTALTKHMRIRTNNGGFQSEILVEFHYHNFLFCQRSRFSPEQASTFLSVMRVLHTRAIVESKMTTEQARVQFEGLVKAHSRQLPPFSVGIFSPGEVALIRAFADKSFFSNYKLYAFAYLSCHNLSVRATTSNRLVPKPPACAVFIRADEIDPREVPELRQHLVDTTSASAATHAAVVQDNDGTPLAQSDPGNNDGKQDDDVSSAIEQAMMSHLGCSLDDRLKLPE
eukprot:TRINITY_DN57684_c0_g1_i1.p1 TRINITY_DN57684_c0_g1~~TRINITY_DN57684_c0_g1_i1.p1  ORF type:complete len:324 (-),score=55.30 TRINITY_DN57684_c0_g1_i1:120-1091(-)